MVHDDDLYHVPDKQDLSDYVRLDVFLRQLQKFGVTFTRGEVAFLDGDLQAIDSVARKVDESQLPRASKDFFVAQLLRLCPGVPRGLRDLAWNQLKAESYGIKNIRRPKEYLKAAVMVAQDESLSATAIHKRLGVEIKTAQKWLKDKSFLDRVAMYRHFGSDDDFTRKRVIDSDR